MSNKVWIIFAAGCIILLGTLVFFASKDRLDVSTVEETSVLQASEQSGNIADQVLGNPDSKVVLVEYGDFQCPGCRSAHPTVKAVAQKYEDQIAVVFRNFPLTTIHPNARVAAAAAEAAGLQGKYWEMHDKIFDSQDAWKSLSVDERVDAFVAYAKELGLNEETFRTDIAKESVSEKISFDQALGSKVGVTGTPAFYLNGKVIEQSTWGDPVKFQEAILAELKENNITVPETDEK